MATQAEHLPPREKRAPDRAYAPDILPQLQSLLADLADIDFAYETSLEAIRCSPGDDSLKCEMIDKLKRHHRACKAPYIQRLAALQERIRSGLWSA